MTSVINLSVPGCGREVGEGCDAICVLLLPNELSDRCVGVSGWMANIVDLAMMFERDLFGALSPTNIIPLG